MKNKITVVGAGNVGSTLALYLAMKDLGDIVLVDVVPDMPQGKALDILQAGEPLGFSSNVIGTNEFGPTEGSNILIMTAGLARKPGMDRLDLLKKNAEIVDATISQAKKHCPDAMILMVTNPIDVMVYHAFQSSGLPKNKVFGQAGVLDRSRFATFVAMELGVSVREVKAMVLGGHGDSMVPLPRYTTVSGIPITDLIPQHRIDALVDRTAKGGGEIVALLKTGSAYYAPAASTAVMVEAVLKDSKTLYPVSCLLEGEYGISGVYVGVPAILGRNGVEKIVELPLTPAESQALKASAEIYKQSVAELG